MSCEERGTEEGGTNRLRKQCRAVGGVTGPKASGEAGQRQSRPQRRMLSPQEQGKFPSPVPGDLGMGGPGTLEAILKAQGKSASQRLCLGSPSRELCEEMSPPFTPMGDKRQVP